MSARSQVAMKSLSSKIFSTVLAFTLGIIVVMSVVLTCIYYFSYEHDSEARLMAQAQNAAAYLNRSPSSENVPAMEEQFAGLVRFTLVDAEGVVLYDSATADVATLENHGNRPEIVAAESSGSGAVTRFSETLGTDTVYAAVLLDDGSVVRLSETRESLLAFAVGLIVPIVLSLAVAAVLVLVLSRVLTRRIMKPIDALDFSDPLQNDIYDEMNPLLERIDEQQRQLKAQNKELARAESMRRDFSANVSHEMKTPLQVIAGYAELMKGGMVPAEDVPKFAGLIYDESQAMRSLINDVLTLSRLDEAAFAADSLLPVDMRALADRVERRLDALARERGVDVRIEGEHLFIAGSETLAEEVLYNLIENGIRYNHEGGWVRVSIRRETAANPFATGDRGISPEQAAQFLQGAAGATSSGVVPAQRQVVIRVQDTGPGIPADKHDKIFERFYRMEKSRSKETGGTGLGLAIVKHAVQRHGGTIAVESSEGHGATFVLRFPELAQVG